MDLLIGNGRAGRLRYLLTSVGVAIGVAVAVIVSSPSDPITGERQPTATAILFILIGVWLQLMNTVRRLHDLGHPWYWLLIAGIPILGWVFGLYLLFAPGIYQRGPVGFRLPGMAQPAASASPVIDEREAHEAHNQQFLNDDGSFDMDGLFRGSSIDRS